MRVRSRFMDSPQKGFTRDMGGSHVYFQTQGGHYGTVNSKHALTTCKTPTSQNVVKYLGVHIKVSMKVGGKYFS